MKPRVFVGSSTEGRKIADALHANLQYDAEVTVWYQDIFQSMETNLDSLLKALDKSDFGLFVFSPDDEIRIRDSETSAVRDNVLFEMGLFVGRLGRSRSAFVMPRGVKMRIPSDLLGVNPVMFEVNRQDKNWQAALGPAAAQIREVLENINTLGLPRQNALTSNDIKLLSSATEPHYPSHTAELAFGNEPELWDNKLCMRYIRLVAFGLAEPCGDSEVQISENGKRFLASAPPNLQY